MSKNSRKKLILDESLFETAVDYKKRNQVKTIKESKALNEGAGAGYNINGELSNIKITKINSIDVQEKEVFFGTADFAIVNVEGTAEFEGTAESYYYGGEVKANVAIDTIELNPNFLTYGYADDYKAITVEDLNYYLEHRDIEFKSETIGGGWAHSPFDGNVVAETDETEMNEIYFHFVDESDIAWVDTVVENENITTYYELWDENGDYQAFEISELGEEEQAIKYAKDNGYVKIERRSDYFDQEGNYLDDADSEIIWEKDEDEEIDESLDNSRGQWDQAQTAKEFGIYDELKDFENDLLKIKGVKNIDFDLDGMYDNIGFVVIVDFDIDTEHFFEDRRQIASKVRATALEHEIVASDPMELEDNYIYWAVHFKDNKRFESLKENAIPSEFSDEKTEIIAQGKADWVKTDEDEKVWNALTDDDKFLLSMSSDMGFWFDEIQGNEEIEDRYYELESKFSSSKIEESNKTKHRKIFKENKDVYEYGFFRDKNVLGSEESDYDVLPQSKFKGNDELAIKYAKEHNYSGVDKTIEFFDEKGNLVKEPNVKVIWGKTSQNLDEDFEDNGKIGIDLNTGVVRVIDAGQYGNPALELPEDAEDTDNNKKAWDEYVAGIAKEYIEDGLHETDPSIYVNGLSYYHPKYYNFGTDEIEFTVVLSKELLNKLFEQYSNDAAFTSSLSRYESRDGFISRMASTAETFKKQCQEYPWKSLAQIFTYNGEKDFDKRQTAFEQNVWENNWEADLTRNMEESLNEDTTDKAKFDYAIIEFIEGGPSTDTVSERRIREAKRKQTKFTDLDKLGDLLFNADTEVASKTDVDGIKIGGYDKCYIDLYGTYKGKEVKFHGVRFDLGDGLERHDHLENSDISKIEDVLTKEAQEPDTVPATESVRR